MLEQNNLQSSNSAALANSLYQSPCIEIIELEIEGIIASSTDNAHSFDFRDGGDAF